MSSVSFSLTDKYIIDPILALRTPLVPKQERSWTTKVWYGIRSEVVTRMIAIFASIFGAVDAFIHFAIGVYKGICHCSKSEFRAHIWQAGWFARFAVFGSIAGVLSPDIMKLCSSIYIEQCQSNKIPVLKKSAGREIPVPVGKPFAIELWHSPSTGHSPWEISKIPSFITPSSQYRKLRHYWGKFPPPGNGDDYGFVFEPKEAGKGTIVMRLPCDFDATIEVKETFTIVAS